MFSWARIRFKLSFLARCKSWDTDLSWMYLLNSFSLTGIFSPLLANVRLSIIRRYLCLIKNIEIDYLVSSLHGRRQILELRQRISLPPFCRYLAHRLKSHAFMPFHILDQTLQHEKAMTATDHLRMHGKRIHA